MEVKYVLTKSGQLIFGSKENSHYEISGKMERTAIFSAGVSVLPESEEEFQKLYKENQLFGFTGKSIYYNKVDERRLLNVQKNLISENFQYEDLMTIVNVLKSLSRVETHAIEVNVRRQLQVEGENKPSM